MKPVFNQVNIVVRDMNATLTFYRRLGLKIDAEENAFHVNVDFQGLRLEFDTATFVSQWDTGSSGATGGTTVLGFGVRTRSGVDKLYANMVEAGYRGRQPPYDGFWGARYAIVEDPDGNPVGIMSPIKKKHKFWPPVQPPTR
jgi:catechol 2,3-dioxygenase-like lactoylglutathione lyase family enzyme